MLLGPYRCTFGQVLKFQAFIRCLRTEKEREQFCSIGRHVPCTTTYIPVRSILKLHKSRLWCLTLAEVALWLVETPSPGKRRKRQPVLGGPFPSQTNCNPHVGAQSSFNLFKTSSGLSGRQSKEGGKQVHHHRPKGHFLLPTAASLFCENGRSMASIPTYKEQECTIRRRSSV